jgi:hypothetical protein
MCPHVAGGLNGQQLNLSMSVYYLYISVFFQAKRLTTNDLSAIKVIKLEPGEIHCCRINTSYKELLVLIFSLHSANLDESMQTKYFAFFENKISTRMYFFSVF